MMNSGNIRNWQKKSLMDLPTTVLFFSSTYCKRECVVSILFPAYVVKSQEEVISMEVIKMRKFYKDTLVKNKFTYFTSYGLLRTHKYPRCIFLWSADSDS